MWERSIPSSNAGASGVAGVVTAFGRSLQRAGSPGGDVAVVDVREAQEFVERHVLSSMSLPFVDFDKRCGGMRARTPGIVIAAAAAAAAAARVR